MIRERPPAESRWLPVTAKSRIGPPFSGLGAPNELGTLTPAYRKAENTSYKNRTSASFFIPFC